MYANWILRGLLKVGGHSLFVVQSVSRLGQSERDSGRVV